MKPPLFLFFIVAQFHVKLVKMVDLVSDFFGSKMKLVDGYMKFKWHEIMKPPDSVGKKNETDGTRLRRGRQFHFFPDRIWTVS